MSEFAYHFINSLTMNEKAYFKKQAKGYGNSPEKNYLRLFDAFDKMDSYDREKLLEKFEGESIGKYLSSEVNYLLDQIIKSLVNFGIDTSEKRRLLKTILSIDVLIEKGFQKQALKILYKSKKLAYRFEDFTTVLQLIQIEEEILFKSGIRGFTEQLAILNEERQTFNAQIQNLNTLRLMREQIRELQFSNVSFNEISNHPHFHLESAITENFAPLSIKAKDHWYYIITLGYYLIQNYEKANSVSEEYITFLKEHDFKKQTVLTAISNHLYFCALTKNIDAYTDMLSRLDKLEQDPKYDRVYISYIKYARELELHYQLHNGEISPSFLNCLESFLHDHLTKMADLQSNYLLFLTVRTFLASGQYQSAVKWLNLWQQQGVLEYSLIYSRIFSMILHMELGWYDLLETELDRTYKVLKRHNKHDDLGRVFLVFFKSILKNPNRLAQSLTTLEGKLKSIYDEFGSSQNYRYFNFLVWCQSKRMDIESN